MTSLTNGQILGKGKRVSPVILYVDDDEDAHLLMLRACRKCGIAVPLISLTNGAQAINYLAGSGIFGDRHLHPLPGLLLLDLKMPVKNGFDVLKYITNVPDFPTIPVILFSCSDERSDVATAYSLGCTAYVKKPCSFDDLKTFVAAMERKFFPDTDPAKVKLPFDKDFSQFVVPSESPSVGFSARNPLLFDS